MMKNLQLAYIAIFILFAFTVKGLHSASNQLNNKSSNEQIKKRTKGGKAIAPVVDIMEHLKKTTDYVGIREEMSLLKNLGFERVYLVLANPGYPVFSNPMNSVMLPHKGTDNFTFESLMALGDPNWAYMHEAHNQGLEAWAIIKPYESGGGITIPHGAHAPTSLYEIETVGGEQIYFDNLLSNNSDLRVLRKPDPDSIIQRLDEPITSIEVAFSLDPFKQKSSAAGFFEFKGIAESEVNIPGIKLWVSKDNGRYMEFNGEYEVSSSIEYRWIKDANGFVVCDSLKKCLVMKIQNMELPGEYRYIAITLDNHDQLYTIPFSMIKVYSRLGEIPITAGFQVRAGRSQEESIKPPDKRMWGLEGFPIKGENTLNTFHDWGFEFEWHGTGFWGDGWVNSPVFGIGRGKRKFLHGTPCEAYPKVQEYWLEQVKRAVAMGFEGIDFRLQNHSGMVTDFVNYGYNEPIIQRYKEKHGIDILIDKADPIEIMRIRGDFFLEFLEEAARIIHSSNKKLQIHLRHSHESPSLSDDFNELGFWAMPKILLDWKKAVELADEITLKHYYFSNYQIDMGKEIKAYAKTQRKKVWVNCYIGQGDGLNVDFFDAVEKDINVDGILLYDARSSLISISGTERVYNESNVNKLKAIMKHLEFN